MVAGRRAILVQVIRVDQHVYSGGDNARDPVCGVYQEKGPFIHLRTGARGPTLDLSVVKQAVAAAKATEVFLVSKQRFRNPKRQFLWDRRGRGRRRLQLRQRSKGDNRASD